MTPKQEAALRQARKCLDGVRRGDYDGNAQEAIAAIDEVLAEQPAQTEFKPDWMNYQQGLADGAAAEREACAKVCDEKVDAEYATGKVDHNEMGWTQACAIAIRARRKE